MSSRVAKNKSSSDAGWAKNAWTKMGQITNENSSNWWFFEKQKLNKKIVCLRGLSEWNRFAFVSACSFNILQIVSALVHGFQEVPASCRCSGLAAKWCAAGNTLVRSCQRSSGM
jgi:hypothetical protein